MEHAFILIAGNNAYQRLDELRATGAPLVLSLDYPKAYDVSDPYTSRLVGLDELKHWELAPANAARVHAAGIEFALTADGLESPSGEAPCGRACATDCLKPPLPH